MFVMKSSQVFVAPVVSCRLGAYLSAAWIAAVGLAAGCAMASGGRDLSVKEKLSRVGLELVPESGAFLPEAERGQCLPCRVIPGFAAPALPEHPAGYLIVGVRGAPADREAILQALDDWGRGQTLELLVRRNPYLAAEPESWDARVFLRLP